MEALGKVTHFVSSKNGQNVQKYTKKGPNLVSKKVGCMIVLVMFIEALVKLTHLVTSQNGQKHTKIGQKMVKSDPKRMGRMYKSALGML